MKKPLLQNSILAVCLTGFVLTNQAHAVTATALVNSSGTFQLLFFDTASPGTVNAPIPVSGLTVGDTLVGIDYRPADSVLIGLGYNAGTGATRVYSLSNVGIATPINTLTLATGLGRITADFNPAANAIRVVTSGATSNNLRIPAAGTGALVTDANLNPPNPGIRSTAYSRNNAGGGTSGATTLYEIDGTNNALVTQGTVDFFTGTPGGDSPNNGNLTQVANLTGVTGSSVVGFDIFNAPGTAATSPGSAFLASGTGGTGTVTILSLNLTTAAASNLGTLGGTYTNVVDIATVPEPSCAILFGLAAAGLASRRRRKSGASALAASTASFTCPARGLPRAGLLFFDERPFRSDPFFGRHNAPSPLVDRASRLPVIPSGV